MAKQDQRARTSVESPIGEGESEKVKKQRQDTHDPARSASPDARMPGNGPHGQKQGQHHRTGQEPDHRESHRIDQTGPDGHPVQHRIRGERGHGQGGQQEQAHVSGLSL